MDSWISQRGTGKSSQGSGWGRRGRAALDWYVIFRCQYCDVHTLVGGEFQQADDELGTPVGVKAQLSVWHGRFPGGAIMAQKLQTTADSQKPKKKMTEQRLLPAVCIHPCDENGTISHRGSQLLSREKKVRLWFAHCGIA